MKPLRLTGHAAISVTARRIEIEWVRRTVEAPERQRPDPGGDGAVQAFRRIPEFGDRWLRVVYAPRDGSYHVVTAFFDRRAGKWQ